MSFQIPFLAYGWTWALEPFVIDPRKGIWTDAVLSEEMSPYSARSSLKWGGAESFCAVRAQLCPGCPCLSSRVGSSGQAHPGGVPLLRLPRALGYTSWAELFFGTAAFEGKFKLTLLFWRNACHVLYPSTEVQMPIWRTANIVGQISHSRKLTSQLGNILYLRPVHFPKNNF